MDKMGERLAEVGKKMESSASWKSTKKHGNGVNQPIISGIPLQPVPEWVLRERKWKNIIIIFGLREVNDDQALVKSLLSDLDIPFHAHSDTCGDFHVRRLYSERLRPIVIKLTHANKKQEILMSTRNLRGME